MNDSEPTDGMTDVLGKIFIRQAILWLMLVATAPASEVPPWEDPLVFGINKLPPRSSGWSCPDRESARVASYDRSPGVLSLNGDWRFRWAPRPETMPADAVLPSTDDSTWKTILVPSQWELHGYGTPIYSNFAYPFKAAPPRVMSEPNADWTSFTAVLWWRPGDVISACDGSRWALMDFVSTAWC